MPSGDLATACAAFTSQFEGKIPYLYLDPDGNVTGGCGHLFRTPQEVADISGCSLQDATEAFDAVKVAEAGHEAHWYETLTDMRLTDDQITALLASDQQRSIGLCSRTIQTWDSLPQPAQIALADIAFNTGSLTGWPSLCMAVAAGNWAEAAIQCHRKEIPAPGGVQSERNIATAQLFSNIAAVET